LFLENAAGEVSQQPVIIGLHHQGKYPGYNWIEIVRFIPEVSFGSGKQALHHFSDELIRQLFQYLADLILPGGHIMIEYDSLWQQDTARSLALGIPPIATPLGYLLFSVGCGSGFRDFYFAEGGSEGSRKLQGFKALNRQQAQLKAEEIKRELALFLDRLPHEAVSELESAACDRAVAILSKLSQQDNN
jgi:hypothetical protein